MEHPAAKVLVELTEDKEVGDAIIGGDRGGELLKRANELIKQKIHPTTVIGGYKSMRRRTHQETSSRLKDQINDDIVQLLPKSMSSEIIGSENSFSKLVVDAMKLCERKNESTGKLTPCREWCHCQVRTYHSPNTKTQIPNTNTDQHQQARKKSTRANSWTDT